MSDQNSFRLVDGVYTHSDARDILHHLFSKKIKFHANGQFSLFERFGTTCDHSEKRISELRRDRSAVLDLVEAAQKAGKTVKVKSEVYIELVDEEPTMKVGSQTETVKTSVSV